MKPVLAYYLHHIDPNVISIGSFAIKWYGLSYVMGFLVAFLLMRWLAERGYGQLKADEVGDFITLAALLGVLLGGRLGHMLLYNQEEFFRRPWIFFRVWEGGMASHGGIAGLVVFTYFYAKRRNYNWAGVGDNLVSVAPLGIMFGRFANYINGELYGKAAQGLSWAVQFPAEMERPAIARAVFDRLPGYESILQVRAAIGTDPQVDQVLREVLTPRHPSQIYEAMLEGLLLFLLLFGLRVKFKYLPYGMLTGIFFVAYAVLRIFGEIFREADYGIENIMGIQRGQFYSIFMIAVGAAFIVYAVKWGRTAVLEKRPA